MSNRLETRLIRVEQAEQEKAPAQQWERAVTPGVMAAADYEAWLAVVLANMPADRGVILRRLL